MFQNDSIGINDPAHRLFLLLFLFAHVELEVSVRIPEGTGIHTLFAQIYRERTYGELLRGCRYHERTILIRHKYAHPL